MPDPKYTGSPTGSGNPPGEYSDGYLNEPKEGGDHFVSHASYRGDMNVGGIVETPPTVGNQPQSTSTSTLEARANKENSIPSA